MDISLGYVSFINNAPRVLGTPKPCGARIVARPARIPARIGVASPRPVRITARIEVLSPRHARIAAQIEVLSPRLARIAARIEVASPRPVRMELTVLMELTDMEWGYA
ncbi:unnamed protein product [Prunus armeniaca]